MDNVKEFKVPDPYWKVQKIRAGKEGHAYISVVQFAGGLCHITVKGGCWAIVNGSYFSDKISPYALEILKKLPENPHDYKPYVNTLDIP